MPLRMVEGGVAEELKVDGGVFEGGESLLGCCPIRDDSAAARSSSVGACCMLYPCAPTHNTLLSEKLLLQMSQSLTTP